MTKLRLLAWAVSDDEEATVVFATTYRAALRAGANEIADGCILDCECNRARWADDYVGRPVPAREAVEVGWWFECWHCGTDIGRTEWADRGGKAEDVIGNLHGSVFCNTRCCRKYHSLNRRIAAAKFREIDRLREHVTMRFGAVPIHFGGAWKPYVYVTPSRRGLQVRQSRIHFDFPGMKIGPAEMRSEGPKGQAEAAGPPHRFVLCCAGDTDAFTAWASTTRIGDPVA